MGTKTFLQKINSPFIWINIILMFIFIFSALIGVWFWLQKYTRHNEEVVVPQLTQLNKATAYSQLNALKLKGEITDSGYISSLPIGAIIRQEIPAGSVVKSGRTIGLVINSKKIKSITLPSITTSTSLREATILLQNMGFQLTPPEYILGQENLVYAIKGGGKELRSGQKIAQNTSLTLVVGNGQYEIEQSELWEEPYLNETSTEESHTEQ